MKNFTPCLKQVCLIPILKAVACFLLLLLTGTAARPGNSYFTPTINTQPSSQAVCQGSTTSFTVGASGTGLTYAWQLSVNGGSTWNPVINNSQYSNATTATLTVTAITAGMNNYQYRCSVSDGAAVNSNAATLTVNGNTAPTVWTTNRSNPICLAAGTSSLGAQPSTANSYQWQFSTDGGVSWSNTVDGATYSNSLSTDGNLFITLSTGLSGTIYHYVATAANGCSATSAMDTLLVLQPVIAPPVNSSYVPVSGNTALTVCPGSTTTLNVTASGASTLSYQWMLGTGAISNNTTYSGATTPNLTITGVTTGMNGSKYKVVATDAATCAATSGTITFTVPVVSVTTSPAGVNTCAGSNVTFTPVVAATGGTPTRQWQTDSGTIAAGGPAVWTNLTTNATNASITFNAVTLAMDGHHYRVNITSAGGCNTATTADAILHVGSSGTWLGGVDTNWHIPGNWCGGVPTSTTNVLIPNWAPHMPTISPTTANAFWQSLTMQNASTLRITGGTYPYALSPSAYSLLGTVAYIADADQYILPATHASLTVGGSQNKLLQGNLDVTNTLTLGGSAKIITGTGVLTMKAGSNSIAGASFGSAGSSWVVTGNGLAGAGNTGLGGLKIEQINSATGSVLYPIGPTTAAYNPAYLGNTGTVDNYTMSVNDQVLPGTVFNSGISRSWILAEQTAGGSNVSLQLQWNQPEEESQYVHSSSQITRSDGSSIVQYTAILPVAGAAPYTTAGGSFSSLTQFSVASYALTLPVKLLGFAAKRAGVFNQIDWQVDGADQATAYVLERSADGSRFSTVTQVTAITGKTVYSYIDNDPGNAVTYYRLKMLVNDTRTGFYSRTVTVTNQQGRVRMELRPSVTTSGETNLFVILPQQAMLRVTLTDAIGRIQMSESVLLDKGEQTIPLNVATLARGIYYLRVAGNDGTVKTLSLVKQ